MREVWVFVDDLDGLGNEDTVSVGVSVGLQEEERREYLLGSTIRTCFDISYA